MTRPFREGDIVSVTGTVIYDQHEAASEIAINLDGRYSSVSVKPECVSLVRPHFKPDEMVIYDNGVETAGPVGTVKATNGDDVWVQLADNTMQTWPANFTRLHDEKAGGA